MKKLIIILAIISVLSGCWMGDRLVFGHRGQVFLKEQNTVCLKSIPNDVLKYYLVSSSEDRYDTVLLVENHIKREYPNTCFDMKLKKGISYNIIYIMNDEKLRVDFTLGDYNDLIEEK